MRPHWPLLLPLIVVSAPAWALKPGKHRSIAEDACARASLPTAFCRRTGKAVYEVDYREWSDLSAHAQRERGENRCHAADAAAARIDRLSREIVAAADARDFELAAIDLGRALHTLQDECAHHGMTNAEHAYYSLRQLCTDEQTSPDDQPDAIACAEATTRDALAHVATALAAVNWSGIDYVCRDAEDRDTCASALLPTPAMACSFLELHSDWDGRDSRWNSDIVDPALTAAFANGLAGEPASRSVCGGIATAIDPTASLAIVSDVSGGCMLTSTLCLGKVDEETAAEQDPDAAGGCATTSGASPLAALALLLRRRRRRAS